MAHGSMLMAHASRLVAQESWPMAKKKLGARAHGLGDPASNLAPSPMIPNDSLGNSPIMPNDITRPSKVHAFMLSDITRTSSVHWHNQGRPCAKLQLYSKSQEFGKHPHVGSGGCLGGTFHCQYHANSNKKTP